MQSKSVINIGRKDVIWNYLATFLQIGSGILLFPIILRLLPSETIGVWSIFVTISTFVALFDFGFDPSFTRNITYIFSGVNRLETNGISDDYSQGNINYNLLASTIRAMRWFYSRIAWVVFFILISVGSFYLYHILNKGYTGDKLQIEIAWLLFCVVNTYNIYTLYYDSLVMGSGKVMRNKQVIIVSQSIYLLIAVILIYMGWGLLAIVIAQGVSLMIKRYFSHRIFFNNRELKIQLQQANSEGFKDVIRILFPNSIKLGLTSLGAFLIMQSSVFVGSLYLSLDQIASYGITMQIVAVIGSLSAVYYTSYVPKVTLLRVYDENANIEKIYQRCVLILVATFLIFGVGLFFFGNWSLTILKSQTSFLNGGMLIAILFIMMLEKNHAVAGGFLLTQNQVPFFKASLFTGLITVLFLLIFIKYLHWGVWGMILAPGIANVYNNIKWPYETIKQLKQQI